ncbi:MAG: DUF1501 domain-containing protein [Planctomycetes bacterium]|nr:DUF1501 domain-containing protein [Planctomycetota bacterium]
MLRRSGMGMGMLGLSGLLGDAGVLGPTSARAAEGPRSALASRPTHFVPRAKHVIHVFLNGGPSHIDTFDPKPSLAKYAGKPLPIPNLRTERKTGAAFPSPFRFDRYGQSGIEVSELFAKTARHIDDIAVIRSMQADVPNHEASLMLMNCGDGQLPRPSLGSWLLYGMGTENQNLPGFIAMCPGGYPVAETANWRSAFLPGIYQGTHLDTKETQIDKLVANIKNTELSRIAQRRQLELLETLNRQHLAERPEDAYLEARIESYRLAFNMQMDAAEVLDVSREPKHILDAYGPGIHGRQLLMARRLIERGVRFVQVWHGAEQPWDSHEHIEKEHRRLAGQLDGPLSALLGDLKQRGLLDDTLVLWGGEFGRTPTVELPMPGTFSGKPTGRDHNHWGFSVWLAGGGVKGGQVYGATDEFGFRAVENRVHVHDLHATMLHLLGFDHTRLTYRYAGRDFRLTDVHGRVVRELIA